MNIERIIITAATPWEARPLTRQWGLEPANSRLYRGGEQGRELWLIRTGMGPRKTAEALAALNPKIPPISAETLVVSSGFAGALQPGIRSGDMVADVRETPLELAQTVRETAQKMNVPLHLGIFHSSETVLTSPKAKRAAGEKYRAVAVDMESAAVREWSRSRGMTFVALRTVLDALEDYLPEGVPEDEEHSAGSLAGFVLAHWKELPQLVSLGVRQRRAMRNLVRFTDQWLKNIYLPIESPGLKGAGGGRIRAVETLR